MSNDLFDDEYDPLAPPADTPRPAGESGVPTGVSPGSSNAEDEAIGESGDGGFGGGDGIVRIWFDDEGHLSKVRVSPVWFKKLGPGRTLEQAFYQAFRISNIEVAAPPDEDEEPEDYSNLDFGRMPALSQETLDAYMAMLADHRDRWREAADRLHDEPQPEIPRAQGKSNGVLLTLDRFGHPDSVQFDQQWLDEAQVGSICINVMAAAHKAYERFVPMNNEGLAELERFQMEHDVLVAGLKALIDSKG